MTQEDLEKLATDGDPSYIYTSMGLVFALLCFLLPFRSIMGFCIEQKNDDEDRKYKSICHTFASDYDRENPLTKQQGIERILNIQLKEAEDKGD